jgi:hypothetical protein
MEVFALDSQHQHFRRNPSPRISHPSSISNRLFVFLIPTSSPPCSANFACRCLVKTTSSNSTSIYQSLPDCLWIAPPRKEGTVKQFSSNSTSSLVLDLPLSKSTPCVAASNKPTSSSASIFTISTLLAIPSILASSYPFLGRLLLNVLFTESTFLSYSATNWFSGASSTNPPL